MTINQNIVILSDTTKQVIMRQLKLSWGNFWMKHINGNSPNTERWQNSIEFRALAFYMNQLKLAVESPVGSRIAGPCLELLLVELLRVETTKTND